MSTQPSAKTLRLAVLNPGGSDPDQWFPDFAGEPLSKGHPPVNYHAYAACTGGSFHRNANTIAPEQRAVLLLLRRDLRLCLKTLLGLQAQGKIVAVSLKESGSHQVAELLSDPKRLLLFRQICGSASLALSSTPDLVPLYLGAGAKRAAFLPTPYPVDDPRWSFSPRLPPASPRLSPIIFLGTREFEVPSRNHLAALWEVRSLGVPVTVINVDGRSGRRKLEALGFDPGQLRIIEGRMDYPRYLQLLGEHRLVFQLDRSAVPGQVAGDALLCGVPCIGGDSAIERVAFPSLCGQSRDAGELVKTAKLLIRDDGAHRRAIEESQRLATERLSFGAVAVRLAEVFDSAL